MKNATDCVPCARQTHLQPLCPTSCWWWSSCSSCLRVGGRGQSWQLPAKMQETNLSHTHVHVRVHWQLLFAYFICIHVCHVILHEIDMNDMKNHTATIEPRQITTPRHNRFKITSQPLNSPQPSQNPFTCAANNIAPSQPRVCHLSAHVLTIMSANCGCVCILSAVCLSANASHTRKHTHTHARTQARTHARTHTHTHTHTMTNTTTQ